MKVNDEQFRFLRDIEEEVKRLLDHRDGVQYEIHNMNDRLTGNTDAPTFHTSYTTALEELDIMESILYRICGDIYEVIRPHIDKEREAFLKERNENGTKKAQRRMDAWV